MLTLCSQELQLRWQEYRELLLLLLQWIRHHTAAFEERKFPSSFEEIEVGQSAEVGLPAQAGSWACPAMVSDILCPHRSSGASS
jgi:hypothetical protein